MLMSASVILWCFGVLLGIVTIVIYKKMDLKTAWYAVTRNTKRGKRKTKTQQKHTDPSNTETVCLDTVPLCRSVTMLQDITVYASELEYLSSSFVNS